MGPYSSAEVDFSVTVPEGASVGEHNGGIAVYQQTAAYGHFGRKEFSWEATDAAKELYQTVIGKSKSKNKNRPSLQKSR